MAPRFARPSGDKILELLDRAAPSIAALATVGNNSATVTIGELIEGVNNLLLACSM